MRTAALLFPPLFCLAGCGRPQPGHETAGPSGRETLAVVAQVPLRAGPHGVGLEVTVNGEGPFLFGLDTGQSPAAVVTRALVDRLRPPAAEGFRLSDGSGRASRVVPGVRIDALAVGGVALGGSAAPVIGDGPAGAGDSAAYGTIGLALFRDHVVTIDYPGRTLVIAEGELPQPDGEEVLAYTPDRDTPRIPIRVAGAAIEALIDSGGAAFQEPALHFADLVERPNLGRDLVRRCVLTFDQRNLRVRIRTPEPPIGGQ
jgi:hypothetical protein